MMFAGSEVAEARVPNVPWTTSAMLLRSTNGPSVADPMLQLPGPRLTDTFQSYADGKLAFAVPEYHVFTLDVAAPKIVPKTFDEFHCAKYQLGFVVVP